MLAALDNTPNMSELDLGHLGGEDVVLVDGMRQVAGDKCMHPMHQPLSATDHMAYPPHAYNTVHTAHAHRRECV